MQNYLMDIIIMMNDVVGLFVAIRFYNNILMKKKMSEKRKAISLVIILLIEIIVNITVEKSAILLMVSFVVFFVVANLFYLGKVYVKLIVATFIVVFSFLMELVAALLIVAVFGNVMQDIRENMMLLFLGGVISKILLLLLVEIIIRFKRRNASQVTLRSWLFIISIPVFSIVLSFANVYEPILKNEFSYVYVVSGISILYINIIAFYLFDSIVMQMTENNLVKFREKQLLMQRDQYENIIKGYNQVKKVRHDMLNHLITLDGYLGRNQYHEAVEYIHKLNGELDFDKRGVVSDNVVIDALISNGKSKAVDEEIKFETEIMIPKKFKIDDMDICIVLGNALNNAIEACRRITDEQVDKRIVLKMRYKQEHVLIELKNSYNPDTIKKRKGRFLSSKRNRKNDEIGIGMGNMEGIIEKHGGVYQIDLQEEMFVAKIMLPDLTVESNVGDYA